MILIYLIIDSDSVNYLLYALIYILTLLFLLASVGDNAGYSAINTGTNALSSADHPSVEMQGTHQTASGAHPSGTE